MRPRRDATSPPSASPSDAESKRAAEKHLIVLDGDVTLVTSFVMGLAYLAIPRLKFSTLWRAAPSYLPGEPVTMIHAINHRLRKEMDRNAKIVM